MIFIGILAIHLIVNFVAKHQLSIHFKTEFDWLEKFIHCIENTNIPFNALEWDDAKGDAEAHRKRMRSNFEEVACIIFIKTIFNLVLQLPLSYLGKYTGIITRKVYVHITRSRF